MNIPVDPLTQGLRTAGPDEGDIHATDQNYTENLKRSALWHVAGTREQREQEIEVYRGSLGFSISHLGWGPAGEPGREQPWVIIYERGADTSAQR